MDSTTTEGRLFGAWIMPELFARVENVQRRLNISTPTRRTRPSSRGFPLVNSEAIRRSDVSEYDPMAEYDPETRRIIRETAREIYEVAVLGRRSTRRRRRRLSNMNRSTTSEFPRIGLEDILKEDQEWCCPLCLDRTCTGVDQEMVKLPCKHVFHAVCISKWLPKSCPICRRSPST